MGKGPNETGTNAASLATAIAVCITVSYLPPGNLMSSTSPHQTVAGRESQISELPVLDKKLGCKMDTKILLSCLEITFTKYT